MADEKTVVTPPAPVVPAPPAVEPPSVSNTDVKNHPLFQKLTSELSALQKADTDRKAAATAAEKAAALEKATSEERYADALKLQQETAQVELDTLKATTLRAEMKAALLAQGSKSSDGFFKVALAEYDAETHGTVDAYAEALKTDENYALFFADDSRQPLTAPQKLSAPGGVVTLSKEQLLALSNSDDAEKRMQAINYKEAYYNLHGSFRGLLD